VCVQIKLARPGIQLNAGGAGDHATATTDVDASHTAALEQRLLEMEPENSELQQSLEIIMEKYRLLQHEHSAQLTSVQRKYHQQLEHERRASELLREENVRLQQQLAELVKVFRQAIQMDEQDEERMAEHERMTAIVNDAAAGAEKQQEVNALLDMNRELKQQLEAALKQSTMAAATAGSNDG
jgi:hypothetical protein